MTVQKYFELYNKSFSKNTKLKSKSTTMLSIYEKIETFIWTIFKMALNTIYYFNHVITLDLEAFIKLSDNKKNVSYITRKLIEIYEYEYNAPLNNECINPELFESIGYDLLIVDRCCDCNLSVSVK